MQGINSTGPLLPLLLLLEQLDFGPRSWWTSSALSSGGLPHPASLILFLLLLLLDKDFLFKLLLLLLSSVVLVTMSHPASHIFWHLVISFFLGVPSNFGEFQSFWDISIIFGHFNHFGALQSFLGQV